MSPVQVLQSDTGPNCSWNRPIAATQHQGRMDSSGLLQRLSLTDDVKVVTNLSLKERSELFLGDGKDAAIEPRVGGFHGVKGESS